MGQPSDLCSADQLPRVLDHRRPTIVESDERENAGFASKPLDLGGLARILPDRLLAENVLSRGGRRPGQPEMQVIRCRNIDKLNLRIADYVFPAGSVPLESETLACLPGAGFNLICAHDEFGHDAGVVKAISGLEIGTAVNGSHPAHADYAYAYGLRHSDLFIPHARSQDIA